MRRPTTSCGSGVAEDPQVGAEDGSGRDDPARFELGDVPFADTRASRELSGTDVLDGPQLAQDATAVVGILGSGDVSGDNALGVSVARFHKLSFRRSRSDE